MKGLADRLRSPLYWMVVEAIILERCRRKGLRVTGGLKQWAHRAAERARERFEMRISMAVMPEGRT